MIERFIHQGMVDKAQTFEQEHQLAAKLLQNFLSVMEPTAMQTQPEISNTFSDLHGKVAYKGASTLKHPPMSGELGGLAGAAVTNDTSMAASHQDHSHGDQGGALLAARIRHLRKSPEPPVPTEEQLWTSCTPEEQLWRASLGYLWDGAAASRRARTHSV